MPTGCYSMTLPMEYEKRSKNMRLKDQIKLIKSALKKQELYSDVELYYMKRQLNEVKHKLKLKRLQKKKGFNNEYSKTGDSDTQGRGNHGLRGESEQPKESGKS